MQSGDIAETMADVSRLEAAIGYRPETPIEQDKNFVDRHLEFYGVPQLVVSVYGYAIV
jgi:hypothetical protein